MASATLVPHVPPASAVELESRVRDVTADFRREVMAEQDALLYGPRPAAPAEPTPSILELQDGPSAADGGAGMGPVEMTQPIEPVLQGHVQNLQAHVLGEPVVEKSSEHLDDELSSILDNL